MSRRSGRSDPWPAAHRFGTISERTRRSPGFLPGLARCAFGNLWHIARSEGNTELQEVDTMSRAQIVQGVGAGVIVAALVVGGWSARPLAQADRSHQGTAAGA